MFDNYITALKVSTVALDNEVGRNRNDFISGITNRLTSDGNIYVLISSSYDINECSMDMGNELHRKFVNVKTSRSPYRHSALDAADLLKEAEGSDLVVYLAYHICDQYIQKLPNNNFRHGHHVIEAADVAQHLAKPLIIGHLDNCRHSPCDDMIRLTNLDLDLKLYHIGGSLRKG